MTQTLRILSNEFSRRCLLRSAAGAAGAVTIFGTGINAAMAAKMGQASVKYQSSPKGDHNCANCKVFQPPDACKTVDGTISPNGWCSIWVKA